VGKKEISRKFGYLIQKN